MTMHSETIKRDEERRKENERSKRWASRDHKPWTDDEEMYIVNEWIMVPASQRHEEEISKHLQRTIFACKRKAEELRERLGCSGDKRPRQSDESPVICTTCYTALPKSGQCDYCNE